MLTRRRAAFVVVGYPILSEAFIAYAALGLVRSGWAVDIVPLSVGSTQPGAMHPVHRELADSIRVIAPLESNGDVSPRSALGNLLRRHGIGALRTVDPIRFARSAFTGRAALLADALGRGGPYDIVHCQFGQLAKPVLALRRAGLLDSRVVVHFRGHDISGYVERLGPSAYDETFAEADWFIANCRHFRNRAIDLGCDPGRIDVVPSGCDLARFAFAERRPPEAGPIRLLAVGRLVEKKGHGLAIEAMRLLRAEGCNLKLRIVGDGPLRDELSAQIEDAGLQDRVHLVGALPHAEIAEELARTHVFLAPSVRAPDGDEDAPVNTLKEAMASGAPVVASRHGGIPELVLDGVNGLLCAEGDAVALAESIAEMTEAWRLWPAFGRAGRRKVASEYSVDVANDKLLATYARTLAHTEYAERL